MPTPKHGWKNPRQADRKKKLVTITLSDAAREALEVMAAGGSKSALVERLIVRAWERYQKK
jgi:hypothetical protein